MCGRYANHVTNMREWADILSDWPPEAVTGFNIAPTRIIPVFIQGRGLAMRWGLIPAWSKEASPKYATFNARMESAHSKPAFRNAWNRRQRCLVPALGYYEWRKEGGGKQPYFIRPVDGAPLVMTGLWEPARENMPASCSIFTREAWEGLKHIHPRMPLFVNRGDVDDWFSAEAPEVMEMVNGWSKVEVEAHPVSTEVNSPRSQGHHLMERI